MNPTNHWKLGLFVLTGLLLSAGAAYYLGARQLVRESIEAVSYFDESVQGLEIGAPLKMRGVTIGTVAEISFASDQRLVKVVSDVYVAALRGKGLRGGDEAGEERDDMLTGADLPEDLRVRLATTGITGVRFLEVDYLPEESYPKIQLPFNEPQNYLPSVASTLKSIEDAFNTLAINLPRLMASADRLLRRFDEKLAPMDLAALTASTTKLLDSIEEQVRGLEAAELSRETRQTLADVRELLARAERGEGSLGRMAVEVGDLAQALSENVERMDLPGTTASLRGAADSFGGVGRSADDALVDLRYTLQSLDQAMRSLQQLVDYIERDPGSLLRGRSGESTAPTRRNR